jgi:hypothetical protein
MDKSFTEAQKRHLRHSVDSLRVSLVLIILAAVMMVLTLYGAFYEDTVHSCNDKELNPPEVQKICKQLTKHQWWGAYYERKQNDRK